MAKRTNNMAATDTPTAPTEAPAKKARKSFTRTEKPIYVVVEYMQDGVPVKLDKASLTITLERDADKILERSENSNGSATFVRVQMPKAANSKPAEAPAA